MKLGHQKKINQELSQVYETQSKEIKSQKDRWNQLVGKLESEYEQKLQEFNHILNETNAKQ